MRALFFGSIGTLAETSEIQRAAFNKAFAAHGLTWIWGRDTYRTMLSTSGGQNRIDAFAKKRGEHVDTAAIHATKSKFFQEELAASTLQPRMGVLAGITDARAQGIPVALVTTTSPQNVSQILDALADGIGKDLFDLVVTAKDVNKGKPDPACFTFAAKTLDVSPEHCLIIEDNVDGIQAGRQFGAKVMAFPGANTMDHDYTSADHVCTSDLRQSIKPFLTNTLRGAA
ncbi:HAD family phosphatase [Actibacterium sp. 188UL27-1]|uniref:HAD family hydrolase n=1 Tax=Actibacterium sp. 188UL27-1 TaxID=2786961 RepID=UPI00195BA3F0|nr:HAD-IA family hydrolase [Actibacterium sp. 188UL27-1]MBM7066791.1 HAD-IA family hydrolase [Actibacterium sp. 188UL27-1]